MRQGRNRPGFAGEAGPYRVVGSGGRRDHLDGYVSIETRVSGAKHFAHAAGADKAFNAVGTEGSSGPEVGYLHETVVLRLSRENDRG